MQLVRCALSLADANAGNNSAAKMAMIAITTSSSIKVKALGFSRMRAGFPFIWVIYPSIIWNDSATRRSASKSDPRPNLPLLKSVLRFYRCQQVAQRRIEQVLRTGQRSTSVRLRPHNRSDFDLLDAPIGKH